MKAAKPGALMSARPLEGLAVGISVAYGEDSAKLGFAEEEMNRSVVRLADTLLAAGARLIFGHDWRPNGVMAAIADLAVRYEPSTPSEGSAGLPCRITNLVPWGSPATLSLALRQDLEARGILRVEEIPLPEHSGEREPQFGRPTLRALGLSCLRERLAALCVARVCLGGKYKKYEGFWPGIMEEAWTGAKRNQPVFMSGMLGGAAELVLEASRTAQWGQLISGNPDPKLQSGLAGIRQMPGVILPDFRGIADIMSWHRLQIISGLEEQDWQRLNNATDIEVVSALVLKGLIRTREGAGFPSGTSAEAVV